MFDPWAGVRSAEADRLLRPPSPPDREAAGVSVATGAAPVPERPLPPRGRRDRDRPAEPPSCGEAESAEAVLAEEAGREDPARGTAAGRDTAAGGAGATKVRSPGAS